MDVGTASSRHRASVEVALEMPSKAGISGQNAREAPFVRLIRSCGLRYDDSDSAPRRHGLVSRERHREDANSDHNSVQEVAVVHQSDVAKAISQSVSKGALNNNSNVGCEGVPGVEQARVDEGERHGAEAADERHEVVQLRIQEPKREVALVHHPTHSARPINADIPAPCRSRRWRRSRTRARNGRRSSASAKSP